MKSLLLFIFSGVLIASMVQCSPQEDSLVVIHVTDAPMENTDVVGVFVTISDVQYQLQKDDGLGKWQSVAGLGRPIQLNLMELTDGNTFRLSQFDAVPGNYAALRFAIEAPIEGESFFGEPSSFLLFKSGQKEPLYIPQGGSFIHKAEGSFIVPLFGTEELIADFSSPKSISLSADGLHYIIAPKIRVVPVDISGSIQGTVENFRTSGNHTMVYAFESGSFSTPDLSELGSPQENPYRQALTWDRLENNKFQLAALPRGRYDLYFASFDASGQVIAGEGKVQSIVVDSGSITQVGINANEL